MQISLPHSTHTLSGRFISMGRIFWWFDEHKSWLPFSPGGYLGCRECASALFHEGTVLPRWTVSIASRRRLARGLNFPVRSLSHQQPRCLRSNKGVGRRWNYTQGRVAKVGDLLGDLKTIQYRHANIHDQLRRAGGVWRSPLPPWPLLVHLNWLHVFGGDAGNSRRVTHLWTIIQEAQHESSNIRNSFFAVPRRLGQWSTNWIRPLPAAWMGLAIYDAREQWLYRQYS